MADLERVNAGRAIDKNHIFLLECMEDSQFKPDYSSIGQKTGKSKDAVRMRFARLRARIHAAEAAQAPTTTEATKGESEASDAENGPVEEKHEPVEEQAVAADKEE